jgi:hypothetical protein
MPTCLHEFLYLNKGDQSYSLLCPAYLCLTQVLWTQSRARVGNLQT